MKNLIIVLILLVLSNNSHSEWTYPYPGGQSRFPTKELACAAWEINKHHDNWHLDITYPVIDRIYGYTRYDQATCRLRSESEQNALAAGTQWTGDCSRFPGTINVNYSCVDPKGGPGCGGGSSSPSSDIMDGNPCNAASGNKFQVEVDYSSSTLSFVRYYNSIFVTESVLGKQWTHHDLASLTIASTINVNRPDGQVLKFYNNLGNWVSDADITDTLTPVDSLWEYKVSNDSIETYNVIGQLLSITTREGKTTQYSYNLNNLLEQITDPYGRTLGFTYDTSGRLITLTTPENTQIHYVYNDHTNILVTVIYPDNTPGDLNDNPKKNYHYENVAHPLHLTGITDENGVRYATWDYNSRGAAVLSEHANGAERVELVYNNDDTTTVTDALGRVKTYTFETHFGLRKPSSVRYSYNDGNLSVTKSKTFTYYPENGRVKEVTDYNGNITYYEYNTRGLITLETQAKGTPEEYTVTTTWHPDYRLPVTRSFPDKTVSYEYNANGLLTATHSTANP